MQGNRCADGNAKIANRKLCDPMIIEFVMDTCTGSPPSCDEMPVAGTGAGDYPTDRTAMRRDGMTGGTGHSIMTRVGRVLRMLLLVPFLLSQFIAVGTMAEAGPDGLRMVLCSGERTVEVILAADGTIHPVPADDDSPARHDPCPWSVTIHQALLNMTLCAPHVLTIARGSNTILSSALPLHQACHVRPHTRGPPTAG